MSNSLFKNMNRLNSNGAQPKNTVKNVEAKPKETANPKKSSQPQNKRLKRGKYKKLPKLVEFPTNLKISNHQRNKLRALALTGHAMNQKAAIDFLLDFYYDHMDKADQKVYNNLVKTLNKTDSERYKKTH